MEKHRLRVLMMNFDGPQFTVRFLRSALDGGTSVPLATLRDDYLDLLVNLDLTGIGHFDNLGEVLSGMRHRGTVTVEKDPFRVTASPEFLATCPADEFTAGLLTEMRQRRAERAVRLATLGVELPPRT